MLRPVARYHLIRGMLWPPSQRPALSTDGGQHTWAHISDCTTERASRARSFPKVTVAVPAPCWPVLRLGWVTRPARWTRQGRAGARTGSWHLPSREWPGSPCGKTPWGLRSPRTLCGTLSLLSLFSFWEIKKKIHQYEKHQTTEFLLKPSTRTHTLSYNKLS